jgi:hypothetical protein
MYWPKRNREPAKWVAIDKPQYNKHT